jgi:transposase
MPHPYSEDLRLRVVNAVESGQTTREVSALYQVSPSFVAMCINCGERPARRSEQTDRWLSARPAGTLQSRANRSTVEQPIHDLERSASGCRHGYER